MSSQREAYSLPTTDTRDRRAADSSYSAFATGYAAGDGSTGPTVAYTCGECGKSVSLGKGDPIRCTQCGHRVLFKERTKRMVQFEAR